MDPWFEVFKNTDLERRKPKPGKEDGWDEQKQHVVFPPRVPLQQDDNDSHTKPSEHVKNKRLKTRLYMSGPNYGEPNNYGKAVHKPPHADK